MQNYVWRYSFTIIIIYSWFTQFIFSYTCIVFIIKYLHFILVSKNHFPVASNYATFLTKQFPVKRIIVSDKKTLIVWIYSIVIICNDLEHATKVKWLNIDKNSNFQFHCHWKFYNQLRVYNLFPITSIKQKWRNPKFRPIKKSSSLLRSGGAERRALMIPWSINSL